MMVMSGHLVLLPSSLFALYKFHFCFLVNQAANQTANQTANQAILILSVTLVGKKISENVSSSVCGIATTK